MMINDNHNDILGRLDAMREQEDTTSSCCNYFKRNRGAANAAGIDEACRKSIAMWVQQVQKTLSLSPETTWIAMRFFDRYLSSGKGNSREVLSSRSKFQLAAITSFYTAVKIYEPVVFGLEMLIKICRGQYTESDIQSMEQDILSALDWRVACHTPLDFARHLLEGLPEEVAVSSYASDDLLDACQRHLDYAVTDINFSCLKPSVLGIASLARSLTSSDILSLQEKQAVWLALSEMCSFDLVANEVILAQEQLLSQESSPCKPSITSVMKLTTLSQHQSSTQPNRMDCRTSSPRSVTQTARQA